MHTATETQQKKKLLDSVIKALDGKEELGESRANMHAHSLRAKVHLDMEDLDATREDARKAIALGDAIGCKVPPTTYRVLADASEAKGDIDGAITALKQWSTDNPQFATKVGKEIQRLRSM